MAVERHTFNIWTLVRRSEENPAIWRAEIPSLDYWAQGPTPMDAIDAAREVALTILSNDLGRGRDPEILTGGEVEDQIARILLRGAPMGVDEAAALPADSDVGDIVALFRFDSVRVSVSPPMRVTALVPALDSPTSAG